MLQAGALQYRLCYGHAVLCTISVLDNRRGEAHCASMSAAVPATCGVAIEVPVSWMYRPPSPVDSTFTPGAITCTVFVP